MAQGGSMAQACTAGWLCFWALAFRVIWYALEHNIPRGEHVFRARKGLVLPSLYQGYIMQQFVFCFGEDVLVQTWPLNLPLLRWKVPESSRVYHSPLECVFPYEGSSVLASSCSSCLINVSSMEQNIIIFCKMFRGVSTALFKLYYHKRQEYSQRPGVKV